MTRDHGIEVFDSLALIFHHDGSHITLVQWPYLQLKIPRKH